MIQIQKEVLENGLANNMNISCSCAKPVEITHYDTRQPHIICDGHRFRKQRAIFCLDIYWQRVYMTTWLRMMIHPWISGLAIPVPEHDCAFLNVPPKYDLCNLISMPGITISGCRRDGNQTSVPWYSRSSKVSLLDILSGINEKYEPKHNVKHAVADEASSRQYSTFFYFLCCIHF